MSENRPLRIVSLDTCIADYVIDVDAHHKFRELFEELKAMGTWAKTTKAGVSADVYDAIAQKLKAIQAERGETVEDLMTPGGTGFNVLSCIKALLGERAVCTMLTYFGIVTNDRPKTNGEIIQRHAKELGVDLVQPPIDDLAAKSSLRTPVSYVFKVGNEKYFAQNQGRGAEYYTPENIRPLIRGLSEKNDALFLPANAYRKFSPEVFRAAIDEAKKNKMRIYMALPTSEIAQEYKDEIKQLIADGDIDMVLCNIDEVRMLFNEKYEGGEKYLNHLKEIGEIKEKRKTSPLNQSEKRKLTLLEGKLETQNRRATQELLELMPKRTNKDELSSAWISDGANKAWLIRNGEATSVEPEQYPLEKVINPTGAGDSTFGVQIVADFLNISPIKSVITACKVAAGKIATKFAQAIGAKSWAEDIAWQNTSPRMDYFTR